MTSQITSVQSARYDEHNRIVFTVTSGDVTGVETYIFNRPQDSINDNMLKHWLADNNDSVATYVADPDPIPTPTDQLRRQDRSEEFAETLDRLNPAWFSTLTTLQQTSINTWRQSWLDYPNDVTLTRPVRPEGIF